MGLQNSITAIGSVILSSSVNSLGSTAVASMTAASKVADDLQLRLRRHGHDHGHLLRAEPGRAKALAHRQGTALRHGHHDRLFRRLPDRALLPGHDDRAALCQPRGDGDLSNAHIFLVINSATSFLLAFVINFRYVIQGLGFSNYALFAGLFEMVARTLVAFLLVPRLGFPGACLATPRRGLRRTASSSPASLP